MIIIILENMKSLDELAGLNNYDFVGVINRDSCFSSTVQSLAFVACSYARLAIIPAPVRKGNYCVYGLKE